MKPGVALPIVALLLAGQAYAQDQPGQDQSKLTPKRQLAIPVRSSDVKDDRTVSFHIAAPEAKDVRLRFDGKLYPMTKDEKGDWSITIGPIAPEFYEYAFDIDGANANQSTVEVPGNPPLYDQLQNVPHGGVVLMTYFSKVQNRMRPLRVYLPPQYFTEPNRRFPVLYLYNGSGEEGWTTGGRANVILDNYIAQNKAVPMIIVMPNNNINDGTGHDAVYPPALDNMTVIGNELGTDIFPMIGSDFRIYNDREHRAIAGLSFGGGTAFGVGTRHLDWFDYIGEFGTGTFGGADDPPPGHVNYIRFDPDKIAPGMIKNLTDPATKPKILFMSVGDRDSRYPFQKKAYEDFKAEGVDVSFRTYPGGHEVKVFRPSMAEFVTLIFK